MIRNATQNTTIADNARVAKSLLWRMRGMIGRSFTGFDALIFHNNNSIHMFCMQMPLDILFLDRDNRVISVRENLKPWRLAAEWKAKTVVELPVGAVARSQTQPGDQLEIDPASTV